MKKTLVIIGVALSLLACKKNNDGDQVYSYTSTEDNSAMEKAFDGVGNVAKDAIEKEGSSDRQKKGWLNCWDELTLSPTLDTLTLQFNGTVCHDGVKRQGTMIVAFTGGYKEEGTVVTTTLQDFYVNDEKLEGKRVVTNKGRNSDGALEYEVVITDGKLTFEDGKSTTWASTRTRVWEDGENTPLNVYDDTYTIYGSANGVNRDGLAYAMTVSESNPLLLDMDCWKTTRLPKSGKVTVSPDGLEDRSIDYGSGNCDRSVTVGIGDYTINVTL